MGIVAIRSRGINQVGEVVIEFTRAFLAYRRGAAEVQQAPVVDAPWTVG